jgi:hypothetical protein
MGYGRRLRPLAQAVWNAPKGAISAMAYTYYM